jgi:Glycosyltransferase
MPTITHLFKTYFPDTQGGLEEAIRQIGKYALKEGYDVKVISVSHNPNNQYLDGIKCVSYKNDLNISTMPISFKLVKDFWKIIDETDIIQIHSPYPFVELLTLFHKISKPIILTYHAEIVGRDFFVKCYYPFYKKLFTKVNVIVPTSLNLAKSTPILDYYPDKIYPINLWLDQERFLRLDEPLEEFKEFVLQLGDFALFVGVLRRYKGLSTLLDAAKNIKRNIVIVGKGPEMLNLKNRIISEKISNIFLLGYQSDENIAFLLKKCSFFVLPSSTRGECFGQVLLEASYFHKALISTELGTGTSFVNIDNLTGFVVPPQDAIALQDKMNYLFENKDISVKMGENAYKRYRDNFTENIQGKKYIELYKRLLEEKY